MKIKFIAKESAQGLRRNITMSLAMIVTIATSLALLGAALLISQQVDRMKGYWYERVEVSVFMCSGETSTCEGSATTEEKAAVKSALDTLPITDTVYFETQKEAYDHFQEQFRDSPDLVSNVDASALPESFRVKLTNPEEVNTVAAAVGALPGVDTVVDQRQILSRFFAVMNGFRTGALALALLQVIVAFVLISNTVRVAAFSRRRETAIMRLVGAPNWMIRLPFLLEGLMAAIIGTVFAQGALLLTKWLLIDEKLAPNATGIPFIGWEVVWWQLPILLAVALVIAGLSSVLALRKHLKV